MNNSYPSTVEHINEMDGDGVSWNNTTDNSSTFSEAEYLQTHLGARYRSLAESTALSVVYVIILVTGVVGRCVQSQVITGVVGNLATCVVIVWNSHMHTATNCYLFSLAISDTVTLVLGMTVALLVVVIIIIIIINNNNNNNNNNNVFIYSRIITKYNG